MEQDMIRMVKAVVCASVCFGLMLPLNSFAQKGGTGGGGATGGGGGAAGGGGGAAGGGGGGTATPPPAPKNPPFTFTGGITSLSVGSDQPVFVALDARSDGRDAPIITEDSGPDSLILYNAFPIDHPHGVNGSNTMIYVWTPGRADIGTNPQAVFTATTASGGRSTITVSLGPVVDVAPAAISGLTAQLVGDHVEAHWNASANGQSMTYTVVGCYHSLLTGTNLPYLFCDKLDTTTALESLNLPAGPATNVGQPGVPVNYYGIFVNAATVAGAGASGTATANVQ
jgi:hypothetical protein